MPSQPPQSQSKEVTEPTMILAFVEPTAEEKIVGTAKVELLPASGLLRIIAHEDIPKGAVACIPINQSMPLVPIVQPPVNVAPKYSSFDH
ncbi:MAG: hypothetical protein AAGA46_03200 [Cyanobacteria bacterium P01_F01_bin.13]